MLSNPSYCILRNSIYWFNFRLPSDKTVLRFSLRTKDKSKAYALARHIQYKVKEVFSYMSLTKQQLIVLAKKWANSYLESLATRELELDGKVYADNEVTFNTAITTALHKARLCYASNYDMEASHVAKEITQDLEPLNETDSQFLNAQINKQKVIVLEAMDDKLREGTPLPDELYALEEQTVVATPAPAIDSPKLSEVFEEYAKEKINSGDWNRGRTQKEQELCLSVFIELMGDMPINSINKETGRNFRNKVQQYPLNRKKSPLVKDLSIEELLSGDIEYKPISQKTASKHFLNLSSLLKWSAINGYMDTNPLTGMSIKVKVNKKDARKPFDTNDLSALFNSPVFTTSKRLHDYYYWLPLIALHTGARLEEICQLHLSDISEINGVLCFSITDDNEDQQLKNASSVRYVPVHSRLIDLGLVRYVTERRIGGATLLLPALVKYSERYSHNPSKWFGRFKKGLGVTEPTKTFHSFRHSVIDKLRSFQAPDYAIKEIVGHSDESATHGTYGSRNPAPLAAVIEQMDWNEALCNVKPFYNMKNE